MKWKKVRLYQSWFWLLTAVIFAILGVFNILESTATLFIIVFGSFILGNTFSILYQLDKRN